MDTYIILANPQYSLHVFCTRPTGMLGAIAKIQSPTFHVAIGYGFLGRRRWGIAGVSGVRRVWINECHSKFCLRRLWAHPHSVLFHVARLHHLRVSFAEESFRLPILQNHNH